MGWTPSKHVLRTHAPKTCFHHDHARINTHMQKNHAHTCTPPRSHTCRRLVATNRPWTPVTSTRAGTALLQHTLTRCSKNNRDGRFLLWVTGGWGWGAGMNEGWCNWVKETKVEQVTAFREDGTQVRVLLSAKLQWKSVELCQVFWFLDRKPAAKWFNHRSAKIPTTNSKSV